MQASRVNGLTSGVFAFLVPASCLNQKGSDTRSDNTIFLSGYDDLHAPVLLQKRRKQGKLAFPASGDEHTEQREGVSVTLHGVLPRISNSHTTGHRRFFQKNGNTPDVIRQYFPAESGRKRKRT